MALAYTTPAARQGSEPTADDAPSAPAKAAGANVDTTAE
jgi:hypothetical protein